MSPPGRARRAPACRLSRLSLRPPLLRQQKRRPPRPGRPSCHPPWRDPRGGACRLTAHRRLPRPRLLPPRSPRTLLLSQWPRTPRQLPLPRPLRECPSSRDSMNSPPPHLLLKRPRRHPRLVRTPRRARWSTRVRLRTSSRLSAIRTSSAVGLRAEGQSLAAAGARCSLHRLTDRWFWRFCWLVARGFHWVGVDMVPQWRAVSFVSARLPACVCLPGCPHVVCVCVGMRPSIQQRRGGLFYRGSKTVPAVAYDALTAYIFRFCVSLTTTHTLFVCAH
mmetsp:Transcript_21946/g.53827  ORF Transcript_21946/g.53827 Transcript_21946/m.53827 type:complete len:277 (-) Transcript_21946:128-958(-)